MLRASSNTGLGLCQGGYRISLVGSKAAGFVSATKCFLDIICTAVDPLLVGKRLLNAVAHVLAAWIHVSHRI